MRAMVRTSCRAAVAQSRHKISITSSHL